MEREELRRRKGIPRLVRRGKLDSVLKSLKRSDEIGGCRVFVWDILVNVSTLSQCFQDDQASSSDAVLDSVRRALHMLSRAKDELLIERGLCLEWDRYSMRMHK